MNKKLLKRWLTSSVLALLLPLAAVTAATPTDVSLLAGLKARSIGPAGMSGRVAAIDVSPHDNNVIYVGASTGGVWKSVNGGSHWQPVFDEQDVHAIGALAVSPINPNLIWVGTGEGNVRNSVSVGRGVYRSLDGGKTWQHMGLKNSERIHRIIPHPRDANTVYVAAMGQAWGENSERGVYRTRDGGKTWQRILYVDDKTGAAELVMDPSNPDKLFANMWQYRRWPWFFKSGGPGSGLYMSIDGGDSWRQATEKDGLPAGELGRMGIAVAPSDPRIVYALVEAKDSALLRSTDGGYKWETVNKDINVNGRPFYYADIRVDPERPDRLYRLATFADVSDDGGKTFSTLIGLQHLHPDNHALWINPRNGAHMINGNDGGIGISYDRGESWRFVTNLPLAQFYHVRYDLAQPYNLYGGLQDNGSWRGPSSIWEQGPIRNSHWTELGFGDGFDTSPDPDNSRRGYAMSQDGYLLRWDLDTGERLMIRPAAPDANTRLRFNWNAGFAQDPFAAGTIYYGSQFLHKSTDRGNTWTIISPDLTSNNPDKQKSHESGGLTPDVTAAENHTTIVSIAPSPLEPGVIWVGTDDGRVQITRDGGASWSNVVAGAKGVPADTWVPHITLSPHNKGTAFVVFDNHRRSDWTPYLFRVDDYGKRWTSLASKDIDGYALVLQQDLVEPNLLFLGTEFGLYVSFDAGKRWQKWPHGVPTASVMDLAIHPREHDLIVATHGRALYVLDDIRPLRELTRLTDKTALHLFAMAPAIQYQVKENAIDSINSQSEFRGENRPYGALISFWLNAEQLPHPDEDVERLRKQPEPAKDEKPKPTKAVLEIRDHRGALVKRLEVDAKQGVNRLNWDLTRTAYRSPLPPSPWGGGSAAPVVPGDYEVTLLFAEQKAKQTLRVLPDPRLQLSAADYAAKAASWSEFGVVQETLTDAIRQLQDLRADLDRVAALAKANVDRRKEREPAREIGDDDSHQKLSKAIEAFKEKLLEVEKQLWQPPESTKGYVAERDAQSMLNVAAWFYGSSFRPVTVTQAAYLRAAETRTREALAAFESLLNTELPPLREQANALQLLLQPTPPLARLP
ncbi:MAG: WD40/YVTN/BNR-like repeat-containing protein [Pseudomonadota bacterium]